MSNRSIENVILIGAGNVGQHLGHQLVQNGIKVIQVFSRKKRKAQQLAKGFSAKATNNLQDIFTGADLYILAVHDSAILSVAEQLKERHDFSDSLVVHTSGATPSTILKPHFKRYGVFYPLQTFSIHSTIDFRTIPLCIDAKYVKDKKQLLQLGRSLSDRVFEISDEQRATLHVAAVFVNNFTNLMYQIATDLLAPTPLSFDLLRPLFLETALKVQTQSPKDMQTGPAIRGDENTLNRHLAYLQKEHPEYYSIYLQLTQQLFPGFQPKIF